LPDDVAEKEEIPNLGFVMSTTFDLNNRYLIGYGKHKIFILNLETNKSEIYEINGAIYIEILSLKFASSEDG
jgi:hypothetical protein